MQPDHLDWPHQLRRRFNLIALDWDRTAIEDRTAPTLHFVEALENLKRHGVVVGIFTGVKSGFVRWLTEQLSAPKSFRPEDVVIFGDEVGSIGGVKWDEASIQIPGFEETTFCSWGADPGSVPDGVIELSGGSDRLLDFLEYQGEMWTGTRRSLFEGVHFPTSNPSWLIEQEGFDPSREHEMESIFSVGNGYLGVRGASDLPIPSSQTDCYLAGIYDQKAEGFAYSEPEFKAAVDRSDPYSEIVPFPSPFRYALRIDGVGLTPGASELRGHERILDLKKGLHFELFYFEDSKGNVISLRSMRVVSLLDPHLLLHEIEFQVERGSMECELEAGPAISDFSLRYPHLKELADGGFETTVSRFRGYLAARRSVNGVEHEGNRYRARLSGGQSVLLRGMFSIFSSRDPGSPLDAAKAHLRMKSWDRFDEEVLGHCREWKKFWSKADVRFRGKPVVNQAMRFGLYHLRTAAPMSATASVGARGLTGRSYEGHVFWDTEIFMFPFYLYACPDAARNILLYRFHTLAGARRRAKSLGYRGACYAWESTVDGADVTPSVIFLHESKKRVPIFTGRQQIHVTADIAYAVLRYWEVTGDDAFMRDFGVEILVETARFWASRVSERGEAFHILGVIGPDEYHQNVNDNAYTNWMARLNLDRAADCVSWMAEDDPSGWSGLRDRLMIAEAESERWRVIARSLYFPQPNAEGIIEQFEGFFQLTDRRVRSEERLRAPVNRLLNWEEINLLKIMKQADVLMIPFLFPDAWPRSMLEKNFQYYAPLTDHGSSLSPCVHAAIAADIGLYGEADRYFEEALNLDLQNVMQNTPLGIHLGCVGGTWQALVYHFLGLRQQGPYLYRASASHRVLLPLGSKSVLLGGHEQATQVYPLEAVELRRGVA